MVFCTLKKIKIKLSQNTCFVGCSVGCSVVNFVINNSLFCIDGQCHLLLS
jgi:hypothetical protein